MNATLQSLPVFRRFEPLVPFRIETNQYIAKSVDQLHEFEEALALRAQVFQEEYGATLSSSAFDLDAYDFQGDLMVIVCKQTQKVVGTYRLLCSRFTQKFYSQSEFDLSQFLAEPGIKLELGRACVAGPHRRGAVLNLLWRAIIQYAFAVKAKWIFGCSSVKTTSKKEATELLAELEFENRLDLSWNIQPLPHFSFPPEGERNNDETDLGSPPIQPPSLPPLFRSYLKAGAKVAGPPALDLDFKCIDFMTILKLSDLHSQFENRYRDESLSH
jgi:putative hemolysin